MSQTPITLVNTPHATYVVDRNARVGINATSSPQYALHANEPTGIFAYSLTGPERGFQINSSTLAITGNVASGNASVRYGRPLDITTQMVSDRLLYVADVNSLNSIAVTGNVVLTKDLTNQTNFVEYRVPFLVPGSPFSTQFSYTYTGAGSQLGGGFLVQTFHSDTGKAQAFTFNNVTTTSGAGYRFGYLVETQRVYATYDPVSGQQEVLTNTVVSLSPGVTYTFLLKYDGSTGWTWDIRSSNNTVLFSGTFTDANALARMASAVNKQSLRFTGSTGAWSTLQTASAVKITSDTGFVTTRLSMGNSWQVLANASTVPALAVSTETGGITITANAAPVTNGQLTFNLLNDTTLQLQVRGTDGVLRTGTVTLT